MTNLKPLKIDIDYYNYSDLDDMSFLSHIVSKYNCKVESINLRHPSAIISGCLTSLLQLMNYEFNTYNINDYFVEG